MIKLRNIFSLAIVTLLIAACSPGNESQNAAPSEPAVTVEAMPGLPTEQMAIVQTGGGGAEALSYESVPVLSPGPEQVLIKVYAAAVNPVD